MYKINTLPKLAYYANSQNKTEELKQKIIKKFELLEDLNKKLTAIEENFIELVHEKEKIIKESDLKASLNANKIIIINKDDYYECIYKYLLTKFRENDIRKSNIISYIPYYRMLFPPATFQEFVKNKISFDCLEVIKPAFLLPRNYQEINNNPEEIYMPNGSILILPVSEKIIDEMLTELSELVNFLNEENQKCDKKIYNIYKSPNDQYQKTFEEFETLKKEYNDLEKK